MEPNYSLNNFVVLLLPFLCYYLGIFIRKIVFPGTNSPPLLHQLLLGVPVSLVVVSPLVPVLAKTISDLPAFLVSLGIIMEHGMLLNETATRHLSQLRKRA